jgi:hypothetical protein
MLPMMSCAGSRQWKKPTIKHGNCNPQTGLILILYRTKGVPMSSYGDKGCRCSVEINGREYVPTGTLPAEVCNRYINRPDETISGGGIFKEMTGKESK